MTQFKVGDKVRLVKARTNYAQSDEPGWNNSWQPSMTLQVERKAEGVITEIRHTGIYTNIDNYGYPPDSFELVLDWDKPLQTRDGDTVTIITREGRGKYSVMGYIGDEDDTTHWLPDGRFFDEEDPDGRDIINVPEKPVQREVWYNVFKNTEGKLSIGSTYESRKAADDSGVADKRVACIKVVLTEGQFDN